MFNRILIYAIMFMIYVPLAAKDKPPEVVVPQQKAEMYQLLVEAFKELHALQAIPKPRHALELKFSVDDYFKRLPHITVEEPWKLGFIYCRDQEGAAPILLAYRSEDEYKSLATSITREYRSSRVYTNEYYWPHIKLDGTGDSYFEYLVLSLLGSQFSLYWQANYNDFEIVCTRPAIEAIVKVTKPDARFIKESKLIDPTPSFLIEEEQAIVRVVVFTKWGGFIERRYYINRQFPHEIKKIKAKTLARFNCGVVLKGED